MEIEELLIDLATKINELSKFVVQINERVMTLERTVNTFMAHQYVQEEQPERSFSKSRQNNVNFKHMRNTDGSEVFRLPLEGNRWAVVKTNEDGNFKEGFIEDGNGSREIDLNQDEALAMISKVPIMKDTAPREDGIDPNFDNRTVANDE